jgi:hypothetical protein
MTYDEYCNLNDDDKLMCQYGYPQFVCGDEELKRRQDKLQDDCALAGKLMIEKYRDRIGL